MLFFSPQKNRKSLSRELQLKPMLMKILCELDNIFFSFMLAIWEKKKKIKIQTSLFFSEKIEDLIC